MANTKLVAEPRKIVGKKVKRLRRQGFVPAVVYGLKDPESIQLERLPTYLALRDAGDNDVFDLELNGSIRKVLVRDVQRHVLRRDLEHVDFLEVDMNVLVTAEVTLHLVGKSPIENESVGQVTLVMQSVEIEAKPDDLLSEIEVNSELIETPDDTIHVSDLIVPEGVTLLTDPEELVAKFDYIQIEEEEEELDIEDIDAADVEVIGAADEEDEE